MKNLDDLVKHEGRFPVRDSEHGEEVCPSVCSRGGILVCATDAGNILLPIYKYISA